MTLGPRKAVVLVGGKGTRLYPLTSVIPKSLVPVQGRPLLTHLFDVLKRHHIRQVYLCVGHMKEPIKSYVGDGSAFGLDVRYIEEDEPLGTAGPLRLGRDMLHEPFICSNGDELKDIDLERMEDAHKAFGAQVTIALRSVKDPSQYGVARLEGNRILEFVEKPEPERAPSNLINAGIYIIEPEVLSLIREGFCMLETEVFPRLAKEGKLFGFPFSGAWYDTGTSQRYAQAITGWTPLTPLAAAQLPYSSLPYLSIDTSIFKAYDIRGVFPTQIQPDIVHAIARALVTYLAPKEVIIGRDARPSSMLLFDAITSAILAHGVDVVDIGECSTPFLYHSIKQQGSDAGIMITASHNPSEHNGLKLCSKGGVSLTEDDGIHAIKDIVLASSFLPYAITPGSMRAKNFFDSYVHSICAGAHGLEGIRVVVDYGNGMAATTFPHILDALGIDAKHLYKEVDCSFPNHEADPLQEDNLLDLKRTVISNGADIGLAFDGDGDRVGFVDEKGMFVSGDMITAIIAQDLLKENPNEKILCDVRSSLDVRDAIIQAGGLPVFGRPGHSIIKKKMIKENILFAGEKSGHYFFRSNGFFDNAEFAALTVLLILSRSGKNLSEIVFGVKRRFSGPEINFDVADKDGKIREIEEKFVHTADCIEHIDGVTVRFSHWWFNLRKSNTENILRLNMEADTKDLLKEKIDDISRLIRPL